MVLIYWIFKLMTFKQIYKLIELIDSIDFEIEYN